MGIRHFRLDILYVRPDTSGNALQPTLGPCRKGILGPNMVSRSVHEGVRLKYSARLAKRPSQVCVKYAAKKTPKEGIQGIRP